MRSNSSPRTGTGWGKARYVTLTVRPEQRIALRILAKERKTTMLNVLDEMVEVAWKERKRGEQP